MGLPCVYIVCKKMFTQKLVTVNLCTDYRTSKLPNDGSLYDQKNRFKISKRKKNHDKLLAQYCNNCIPLK